MDKNQSNISCTYASGGYTPETWGVKEGSCYNEQNYRVARGAREKKSPVSGRSGQATYHITCDFSSKIKNFSGFHKTCLFFPYIVFTSPPALFS